MIQRRDFLKLGGLSVALPGLLEDASAPRRRGRPARAWPPASSPSARRITRRGWSGPAS